MQKKHLTKFNIILWQKPLKSDLEGKFLNIMSYFETQLANIIIKGEMQKCYT